MTETRDDVYQRINVPHSQSFDEMWGFYEKQIMPAEAGPNQRTETKRAFYVGAMLLRQILMDAPDEDAAQEELCSRIDRELDAFIVEDFTANLVAAGNA